MLETIMKTSTLSSIDKNELIENIEVFFDDRMFPLEMVPIVVEIYTRVFGNDSALPLKEVHHRLRAILPDDLPTRGALGNVLFYLYTQLPN